MSVNASGIFSACGEERGTTWESNVSLLQIKDVLPLLSCSLCVSPSILPSLWRMFYACRRKWDTACGKQQQLHWGSAEHLHLHLHVELCHVSNSWWPLDVKSLRSAIGPERDDHRSIVTPTNTHKSTFFHLCDIWNMQNKVSEVHLYPGNFFKVGTALRIHVDVSWSRSCESGEDDSKATGILWRTWNKVSWGRDSRPRRRKRGSFKNVAA